MAHSWSAYETWDKCPLQYDCLYRTRSHRREESEALEKGKRIHAAIEDWLNDRVPELPEEIHPSWHERLLEWKRQPGLITEHKILKGDCVGIVDILTDTDLVDIKTGSNRRNKLMPREQLKFYVWLLGEDRQCTLAWVEHPRKRAELTLTIRATPTLDKVWTRRLEAMEKGPYDPKPGWYCKWCPVTECPFHNEAGDRVL